MATVPTNPAHIAAINDFKALVDADRLETDDDEKIDPGEEQDWYSLTLGFFLAKGLTAREAHELSIYVRYTLQYWC